MRTSNDEPILVKIDVKTEVRDEVLRIADMFKRHGELRINTDQTRVQLEAISQSSSRVSVRLSTNTHNRQTRTDPETQSC